MADVLGAVAAVVGIVQAGTELSVFIYKVRKAAASAGKFRIILQSIEPEVFMMTAVSNQLASSFQDDENLRLCQDNTLETTKLLAAESRQILEDALNTLSESFKNDVISFVDRLKMYNVEKKINVIQANLDRLRSRLMLILEVINLARNVIKDKKKPKKRDSEMLVELKRQNVEATMRCQRLAKIIPIDGSIITEQLSKFDISFFNAGSSASDIKDYSILDKNGNIIAGDSSAEFLALKLETISELITEVEETRDQVAGVAQTTADDGIWESFKENGIENFRHTIITRHPKFPGVSGVSGVRSITSDSHPVQPQKLQHEVTITEVYVALMGAVGTGKSTFVNVCIGSVLAPTSQSPGRCTEIIEEYHFMYTPSMRVHLIDTPGFDHAHRSEREILTDLLEWTRKPQENGASQQPRLLSGILYFHKISDAKPQLSTHRNIRLLEKLCLPNTPNPSISHSQSTDSTFNPSYSPPPTASSLYTATSYSPSSIYTTNTSYFPPTSSSSISSISSTATTTATNTTTTFLSLHPIILVTTNWEYFLGDDERALQHESDLRTYDEYWGAMIRRGSTVVRYAAPDQESAMAVLGMLGGLGKYVGSGDSVPGPTNTAPTAPGVSTAPLSFDTGVGSGFGENVEFYRGNIAFDQNPVAEPGEYERNRALSLSDSPTARGLGASTESIDAQVAELLAEYTTVVADGSVMVPPQQHRRWTDQKY